MFGRIFQKAAIALINVYQLTIAPWTGNCCRFYPSCSAYAKLAFERHGALRGLYFTLRRLLRCHPFCPAGFDPVPKEKERP